MKNIILTILLLISGKIFAENKLSNSVEPAKYFINHDKELADLSNRLNLYKKAGLLGISGMGKTQLVRMYAQKHTDDYEIIWFFDTNNDLKEQFIQLAKQINSTFKLNDDTKINVDPNNVQKALMDYLAPKQNWLLAFDNLKVNQNDKLKDFINWEHNGHIIICSQDSKNLLEVITLPHFKKEDTIKLAKAILNNPDPKLIEDLVIAFKGYPIMVAQAAMYLDNNRYMNVEEYKIKLLQSDNKPKAHIELVLKQLTPSAKDLLNKIPLIDNQRFSKELLIDLVKNSETFTEDLNTLNRFGLITNIAEANNCSIFEMHDIVKETLLQMQGPKIAQENIDNIIDKIIVILKPTGGLTRPGFLENHEILQANLENILINAEKYSANPYKIMAVRKSLIRIYANHLDYYNSSKMVNWLIEKEAKGGFTPWLMKEQDQVIYSGYLSEVGEYKDFAEANYKEAIKYYTKSIDIIDKIPGYIEDKFGTYGQLAQTLVYSGDINKGSIYINKVGDLIKNNPQVNFDNLGFFWFVKAKISTMEDQYNQALLEIDEVIKADAADNIPEGTFTAPTYILQVHALNKLERFDEAYKTIKKIYQQELNNIKSEHEIHARILTQLSISECGIGKLDDALKSALKAKQFYLNDKLRNNKDLLKSHDVDLADAIVSEANVLKTLSNLQGNNNSYTNISLVSLNKNLDTAKLQQAIDAYKNAEIIYQNCYKEHLKLAQISSLYFEIATSALALKDLKLFKIYQEKHEKIFGNDHPRSVALKKELLSVNNI